MKKIVTILSAFLISSCLSNLPAGSPKVSVPTNGAVYVGTTSSPPPSSTKPVLPEQIKISYTMKPNFVDVFLNGQPIGSKFVLGPTEATVNFSDVEEFLRQGTNTITMGLAVTSFVFDSAGPEILIDSVTCHDGDCRVINGGNVTVKVKVVDPSKVSSVSLQSNTYQWEGGSDAIYPSFKTGKVVTGVTYPMAIVPGPGTYYQVTMPESSMYTFIATDENGYSATTDYLSEGQTINSVFKMRIGKSLLESMIPVAEPKMDNMHIYSPTALDQYGKAYPSDPLAKPAQPLDAMSEWWNENAIFYSDLGAETTDKNNCGYVNSVESTLSSANFTCTAIKSDKKNGVKYCLVGDVKPNASVTGVKNGKCTRVVIWRLLLDDVQGMTLSLSDAVNGRIVLDMFIKDSSDAGNVALETDLGMRHIECLPRHATASFCNGTFFGLCVGTDTGIPVSASGSPTQMLVMSPTNKHLGGSNGYCRDVGGASYLGIRLDDLKVTATQANPKGNIDATVVNGSLNLAITKSTFRLNLSGLTIGSGLDWLISFIAGLLDGMFVDIVVGVIKENMTDFKLGFDIFTESGSTLRMNSTAYQVFTTADNNPATPVEWYMYYAGFLKPYVPHPEVNSPLGTYFKRSDIAVPYNDPSIVSDNFSIGISSNIINQGLSAIYRSGMMHFTVTNLKKDGKPVVLFGPGVSNSVTGLQNGDSRVILIPKSPAIFDMKGGPAGTQAALQYQGATMDIEIYNNNKWVTIFHAKVNIKAGVLMSVVDKKFHMTIDGTPKLEILELLDLSLSAGGSNGGASGSVSVVVSKVLLESAINLVIIYAIPTVAESSLVIDVPDIPGPLGSKVITTTEAIQANSGSHLGFSMGFNLQK